MFNYKKRLELESNGNILKRYTKENSNSETQISKNEYEKNISKYVQKGGFKWDSFALEMEENPVKSNNFDLNDCHITYVNLDRSEYRKEQMEKQLQRENLTATRFSAVDGKKVNLDDYDEYTFNKREKVHATQSRDMKAHFRDMPFRLGHFGCYLSHIKILQDYVKSDKKYLMILEDDAILIDGFKEQLIERIKYIPADWDLILPGHRMMPETWTEKTVHNNDFKIKNGYTKLKVFNGTYSLIYNKRSAKKWLDLLVPMDWYLDWNMSFLAIDNPELNVYGLVHPLTNTPGSWKIENNNFKYSYNLDYDSNWVSTTNMGGGGRKKPLKYIFNTNYNLIGGNRYNWSDFFECIIYVNLANKTERKQKLLENLKQLDIPDNMIHRIDAVYDSHCGHLGCTKSHINGLNLARKNNWKRFLVLEDDFRFNLSKDKILDMLGDIYQKLNNNWDVIMLSSHTNHYDVKTDTEFSNLKKPKYLTGTCSYIVNSNYLDTLQNNYVEGMQLLEKEVDEFKKTGLDPIRGKSDKLANTFVALDRNWTKLQQKDNWFITEPFLGKVVNQYDSETMFW